MDSGQLDLDNIQTTEDFLQEYLPDLPQEVKEVLIEIMQIRKEIRVKAMKMDIFELTPPAAANSLPEIREGALNLENRIKYFSRVEQKVELDTIKGIKLKTVSIKNRLLRDIRSTEKITIDQSGFQVERTVETDPVFIISKKGPHTVSAKNQSYSDPVPASGMNIPEGAKHVVVFKDCLSIESLEGVTLMELLEEFKTKLQILSDLYPLNKK